MRIIATAMLIVTLLAACEPAPQATDNLAELPVDEAITASATATFAPPTASPTWVSFLQTPTPGLPSSTDETPPSPAPPTPTINATPPPQPTATGGQCQVNPPPNWVVSTIQFGQTIGRLAQCVGSTVNELVAVNCLPNGGNLIYPGDPIYMPGICAPTATPDIPPEFKTTTSTSTPLPPPPSKGPVTVNVNQVAPGQKITITLKGYVPNGLFIIDITSPTAGVFEKLEACVDQNGGKELEFTIPDSFKLFATIEVERSLDENRRINSCGGELGGTGYTSGQLANLLLVVTPSPTANPTAEHTAIATATHELSIALTSTPEPPAYP